MRIKLFYVTKYYRSLNVKNITTDDNILYETNSPVHYEEAVAVAVFVQEIKTALLRQYLV